MNMDLALGLVRVTEAAAINASKYMGRGDKNAADEAAVEGMRAMFDSLPIKGTVVIGEGEMDEAPMLYIGEVLGSGDYEVDIAVDPLDGTSFVAKGMPNALAVVAIAEKGSLLHAPDMYMEKLVVGPKARGVVSLDAPLSENIINVAKALNKDVSNVTVVIQDRPRHKHLMDEVRKVNARLKLFNDGDIQEALATCFDESGVDIMVGIGGAPEGVITAAAVKCIGGDFQGRLFPTNDEEKKRCFDMGITDLSRVMQLDDIVKSDDVYFAATGVSDGDILKGVVFLGKDRAKTSSIVMRAKTGTIRYINAIHNLSKRGY
ncbi:MULTISPECIES: class II fructose-bisphosphatase [Caloramator]|uniref:Fructose-1,6-bisphosphatase n=1 Tax=Caloramator proteoclasticus DSM 10124 TaxID=1121262 RepID=A0A1M4S6X5_9CLOT|nr:MULTISPECIES: class II fructose-bisphosphatase [Caloramator]SHE27925.1 fructose-1,6-bisphosphatase II [Caloramator proteoclasticus DSM 10124]